MKLGSCCMNFAYEDVCAEWVSKSVTICDMNGKWHYCGVEWIVFCSKWKVASYYQLQYFVSHSKLNPWVQFCAALSSSSADLLVLLLLFYSLVMRNIWLTYLMCTCWVFSDLTLKLCIVMFVICNKSLFTWGRKQQLSKRHVCMMWRMCL
jgi:hypothetical protein